MKIINLYGSPGAGKSTTAAGVFYQLKLKGFKAELVTEYAKDLTWEENYTKLNNQIYVFAKQHQRLKRLEDKGLEYVITDSPLLLSLVYGEYNPALHDLVKYEYLGFNNINFYLERTKPYVQIGRSQNESESNEIGDKVLRMLENENIIFDKLKGDESAVDNIINWITL